LVFIATIITIAHWHNAGTTSIAKTQALLPGSTVASDIQDVRAEMDSQHSFIFSSFLCGFSS
jgi:hypothetical protein